MVGQRTVNPWLRQVGSIPIFSTKFLARSYNGHYVGLSIRSWEFDSPTSRQFCGKESKRNMGKLLARQ